MDDKTPPAATETKPTSKAPPAPKSEKADRSSDGDKTPPAATETPSVSPVVAKAQQAVRDADAKRAELRVQQEAQRPPAPPEPTEDERDQAEEDAQRAKLKTLITVLTGAPVGLTLPAARLYIAHLMHQEGRAVFAMGRTEVLAGAERFAKANPIAWRPLTHGNPTGFCKGLDASDLEHASPADLQALMDELRL